MNDIATPNMYKITYNNIISIARDPEELFLKLCSRLYSVHPDGDREFLKKMVFAATNYMIKAEIGGKFTDKDFEILKIR